MKLFEYYRPLGNPWVDDKVEMPLKERDEMVIHSEYGINGAYAEVFQYDHESSDVNLGDIVVVRINGPVGIGANMVFIVRNIGFDPPEGEGGTWCMRTSLEPISVYHLNNNVCHASVKFDNQLEACEAIAELVHVALKDRGGADVTMPIVTYPPEDPEKKRGTYGGLVVDGERLIDVIDRIALENGLEYYHDVYSRAFAIGDPAKLYHEEISPGAVADAESVILAGKKDLIRVGDEGQVFLEVFCRGSGYIVPGSTVRVSELDWKVAAVMLHMATDGDSSTCAVLVPVDTILTSDVMDVLNMEFEFAKRKKDFHGKVDECDIRVSKSGSRLGDGALDPGRMYKFNDNIGNVVVKYKQEDPRDWEPLSEIMANSIVMSSPFAGNGVGMLFPIKDNSRHLVFFPGGRHQCGVSGPMVWKGKKTNEEDIVPVCDPQDFYLRLDDGYIYFDEENKTWLIRADKVKLEAKAPIVATTKPDTTATDNTYIKLESGGTVTVHGTTIKLGKDATDPIARKSDLEAIINNINAHGHASFGTGPVIAAPIPLFTAPTCSTKSKSE